MSRRAMRRIYHGSVISLVLLTASDRCFSQEPAATAQGADKLVVETRRQQKAEGSNEFQEVVRKAEWNPRHTAIIVCDMWNDHTCQGAAARVAEMAPAVNRTLQAARDKGVFIIHAPSGTMAMYDDTPQRRRAIEAPFAKAPVEIKWNHWDPEREGEPFTTIAHGGCGCPEACPHFVADEDGIRHWKGEKVPWTRQIETIEIDPADAISDKGQ